MDRKDINVCKDFSITVVAGSSLPRGTSYGPIPDIDIRPMDQTDDCSDNGKVIEIYSAEGTLVSHDRSTTWVHWLRASRDVYEQTLEMYRSRENHIYIRTVRDVAKGERLSVWYEETFGREKHVPYLMLANIRGIQHYQCTRCSKAFPYPNFLKLHMMNGCDNMIPRDHRTFHQHASCFSDTCRFSKQKTVKSEHFGLIPKTEETESCDAQPEAHFCRLKRQHPENPRPLASINCQVSYGSDKNIFTPYTVKASVAILPPVSKEEHLFEKNCNIYGHMGNSYVPDLSRHVTSCSENEEEPIDILHKSFIEFSTRNGHRCVYCGKFYSRKYGLKIHLRTHTGYKPLKCKICLRAFGDPSNLNKHTRLHSEGNTPYKCVYCGKILVRRRDLLRHLNSRHPGHSGHMNKMGVLT